VTEASRIDDDERTAWLAALITRAQKRPNRPLLPTRSYAEGAPIKLLAVAQTEIEFLDLGGLLPRMWSLRHEPPSINRRSMLASTNSDLASLNGVSNCLLGHLIFVGGARVTWLLNEHMPPLFGVEYRHLKLWIPLFDSKRRLLSRFVRFMSRLQLPIYGNMKRFGERRFADCSDRGRSAIGNRRPRLPRSI
jgi:hypothetical protein